MKKVCRSVMKLELSPEGKLLNSKVSTKLGDKDVHFMIDRKSILHKQQAKFSHCIFCNSVWTSVDHLWLKFFLVFCVV
jgi:hypothetical protein